MPDDRRPTRLRRARLDQRALPGDARKRRRERQRRRRAAQARAGIGLFVVVGLLGLGLLAGLAATAAFIDHLPKLSRLGPVELGENSSVFARDCTRKPCQDVALGVIARTENRVSVRWKDIAPTMRSAHGRDRGPALLAARCARLARHRPRGAQQPAGGRHPPGRLDDLAAARQEPLPAARGQQPLAQPQDRRGLDRRAARGQVHEGRDPHGLPQHRLLRRERLRRRGRGAHVLRQDRQAADARAVGAARRPAAGAERLQPVPPPGGRARGAAARCWAPCASCAGSARPPTPRR